MPPTIYAWAREVKMRIEIQKNVDPIMVAALLCQQLVDDALRYYSMREAVLLG